MYTKIFNEKNKYGIYSACNKCILSDWLYYIQNISSVSMNFSLHRIQEVAYALKLLPFNIYTILIGGTNGKGSTCFLLEQILLKNKIRIGLYTSPHVLSYHERIRVCGKELSDDIHLLAFSAIENVRNNIELTYFEFITLSALYIFKLFKLDVVILEVGLGGRLDATNIVDPNISVITNIAMDHLDVLGSTKNQIAIEKSGIFRPYKLGIIGETNYPTIVNDIARFQNVKLFARGQFWNFYCYETQWIWKSFDKRNICLKNLSFPKIPLENAAIVLSILYWLPFKIYRSSIDYGLRKTVVLGRFQVINDRPLIILDVGHNPHAALYIVVNKLFSMVSVRRTIRVVIGMLYNKDIKNTISCFKSVVDIWYCAKLDTSLSASVQQLSHYCSNFKVMCFDNIVNAYKQAIIDSNDNDCILVFGSFYAVGSILQYMIHSN